MSEFASEIPELVADDPTPDTKMQGVLKAHARRQGERVKLIKARKAAAKKAKKTNA